MRDSIILSELESELLIVRGVKEGFVDFGFKSESNDEKYSDLLEKSRISKQKANRILKKLYQNILLYDKIISPSVQTFSFRPVKLNETGFFELGVFNKRGIQDTSYFYGDGKMPDLDHDYALYIKHIVIESILKEWRYNKPLETRFTKILENDNCKLRDYLNSMYDYLYLNPILTRISYSNLLSLSFADEDHFHTSFFDNPYFEIDCIIANYISQHLHRLIFNLETSAMDNAVISGSDFDIRSISKFKLVEKNVANQCYEILKMELKNEIEMLPSFSSLKEVLIFKEKNRQGIERLRSVLDELEDLIRNGLSIQAVNRAKSDINKATKELSRYHSLEKISKWSTLLSLPIGIAELYLNNPLVGYSLTAISFINQISMDMCKRKNNWIYLIR